KHERYDYMKLISEMVTANFYAPFAENCEELGAISRVQCAGSPTDILSAYGLVDVPEGEAMLYDPSYNLIPASAAALSGKNIVSAEAFTCLYGFPDVHFKQEEALDLFMVADALFANGVNMIVWHGKPFNPAGVDTVEFYATTHVGPDGELAPFLKDLNKYMENKAYYMRRGRVYSEAAVYLPWEDALIAGELPEDKQMKWSWGEYEMRYVDMPKELNGFNPLWINGDFLIAAKVKNGKLVVKDQSFSLLYLDAEFLDYTSLKEIYRLANDGMELVLKNVPLEPGRIRHKDYKVLVDELTRMENVRKEIIHKPIVEGDVKFFARKDGDKYFFFFPHPLSYNLKYPLEKGFSFSKFKKKKKVKFNINGKKHERIIEFKYRGIIEPIIE
ncbi:MAG: glycosyl hydrolase, partial [Candidatus Kapaibacterium sp.]